MTKHNVKATLTFDENVVAGTENDGYTDTDDTYKTTKTVVFTQNETKSLAYYDEAGNYTIVPVTVNNIDNSAPMVKNISYSPAVMTNRDVTATVVFGENVRRTGDTDDSYGIEKTVTFSENGTKYLSVEDNVGNTTVVPILVTNIDKQIPTYVNNFYNLDNRTLTLGVAFNEKLNSDNTLKMIVKVGEGSSAEINPTISGSTAYFEYSIPVNYSGDISAVISGKAKDVAGNDSEEISLTVNNIGNLKQTGLVLSNNVYTIKINGEEIDYSETYYINNKNKISVMKKTETGDEAVTVEFGTNGKINKIDGKNVSGINIILDTSAPTYNVKVYPETKLDYGRYVAGKKIIFKIDANEELDIEKTIANRPDIQVVFSASKTAKGNDGKAIFDHAVNNDGKGELYYYYIIEERDEGNLLYGLTEGKLIDLAGNEITIANTANSIDIVTSLDKFNSNIDKTDTLEKGLTVSYNVTKTGNNIKVVATFGKNIWKKIGAVIDADNGETGSADEFDESRAPKLIMAEGVNKDDRYVTFTASNPVQSGDKTTITYNYTIPEGVNILLRYIILGYGERNKLYFLN